MSGKEKLLITGGFGYIGSWLSDFFSDLFDIYILTSSYRESETNNTMYKIIVADIVELDDLKSKLIMKFDYCIHTASYNEFFEEKYDKKALLVNALGTRNLLEVLKDHNLKNFIYLSTFHVYGQYSGYIDELKFLKPKNDYASTHLFAEYYVQQFYQSHSVPFIILRLTNGYGVLNNQQNIKWYLILHSLVQSAFKKEEIILTSNGNLKRDFIWLGDVCFIINNLLCLPSSPDNIFNLSSGKSFSVLSIAKKVQKIYMQRYQKDINIFVNHNDLNNYEDLQVSNKKLSMKVDISFQNKLESEIHNLFAQLEKEKNA